MLHVCQASYFGNPVGENASEVVSVKPAAEYKISDLEVDNFSNEYNNKIHLNQASHRSN